MLEHYIAVLNSRSYGTGRLQNTLVVPCFNEKVWPRAFSSMNILETVQLDDLMEPKVRRVLGVDLLPIVVLVAVWLIKYLGKMAVLGCFMQSFGRTKIRIGGPAAVREFQRTRRVAMSNLSCGIDQPKGLGL